MKYILIALLIAVVLGDMKRYDGYQVLKVDIKNQTNCGEDVRNLAEKLNEDVWSTNCLEGWMHVMVSPEHLSYFVSLFKTEVHIEDVQVAIDVHLEDNERSRNASSVGDHFDWFPRYGEIRQWIARLVAEYSEVSEIIVGETYLENEIYGVSLGNKAKKIFYIHCGIHAREWITVTTCVYFIDQLLNTNPGRQLLQEFHWIVVPLFNVDGYEFSHTNDRMWRKNREPNSGSTCVGTDLNRNYNYGWGGPGASNQPCSETYRGPSANSGAAVRAERGFLRPYLDSGRVICYFDIHSYGGYFLSAWGYTTSMPSDYPEMRTVMQGAITAIRSVNGRSYTWGASGPTLYATSGSTVDWSYGEGGVVQSYTIECYGTNFTPPTSWILPIGEECTQGLFHVARTQVGK